MPVDSSTGTCGCPAGQHFGAHMMCEFNTCTTPTNPNDRTHIQDPNGSGKCICPPGTIEQPQPIPQGQGTCVSTTCPTGQHGLMVGGNFHCVSQCPTGTHVDPATNFCTD